VRKSNGRIQYGRRDFNFGTIKTNKGFAGLAPSFDIATVDLGIDVRVEEIEAIDMEE
jgi:hypothetical protein